MNLLNLTKLEYKEMLKKPKRDYPKAVGTTKDGLKWKWKWPRWDFDKYQWHGGPGYQTASANKTIMIGDCDVFDGKGHQIIVRVK